MPGRKPQYTPSEIRTLRDQGTLSPSEIETLRRAKGVNQRQAQVLRDQGVLSPSELDQIRLRNQGSMSPSEIRSRGFKYFPDNP